MSWEFTEIRGLSEYTRTLREIVSLRSSIVALFLMVSSGVSGEIQQDGRVLPHQVAEAARKDKSYRVEGHLAQDLDLGLLTGKKNFTFRIATRPPSQVRIEVSGGDSFATGYPYVATCEARTGWVYYSKSNSYSKIGEEDKDYCTPSLLTGFGQVDQNVKSAMITGQDHSKFEGRLQSCVVVAAEYRVIDQFLITPPLTMRVGRVSRKMCIDPSRKLILRDHLEADLTADRKAEHVDETITYERIDRNLAPDASLFEFHPPRDAKLFEPHTPAARMAPPQSSPLSSNMLHVITRPEAISETKPEYSQEAWDEGIQGQVILTARVETDGSKHDFRVEQSLGYGLDEKAIECASKWQFRPATDDGKPVPGTAYIVINFVLPDNHPAQPSNFPVERPAKPVRLSKTELQLPTDLDDYFNVIANLFEAPDLCGRINSSSGGAGGGWSPRGLQIETLQSRCYDNLAIELHDPRLCDYVKPVRVGPFDGSDFTPAFCREHLFAPVAVSPNVYQMTPFVQFARRSGVSDTDVAEFVYEHNPYHNPVYSTYQSLRNNGKFLTRVGAAPNYDEPESGARQRLANPLEYLYEMLAVDDGDPSFCRRISPNAQTPDNQFLRNVCIWRIAVNRLDTRLCEQVPRPDTVGDCKTQIRIDQQPGQATHYDNERFPKAALFREVLRQIGDEQDAASIAKPSPDDYWQFLQDLAYRGAPGARTAFLQRVRGLK